MFRCRRFELQNVLRRKLLGHAQLGVKRRPVRFVAITLRSRTRRIVENPPDKCFPFSLCRSSKPSSEKDTFDFVH